MGRCAGWAVAIAVVTVGAGGLACSGLGGGDATDADGAGEGEGDGEGDGVADPEPLPPGTFAVWWLQEVDGSCVWKEQLLGPIAADELELAKLPGPCPVAWRIGPPTGGGDRIVVYGDDKGYVLGQGKIVPFRPIVDRFPLVVVDGPEVLACGDVEGAEVETGSDTHYAWKLDGKTYEMDSDSPTSPVLVRTWALEASGWVERRVAPMETYEGMSAPWCDSLEGFPSGAAEVRPDADPLSDGTGWREPTDAERPALDALSSGQWSVLDDGSLAVRTEWFEGLLFSRPVVMRQGSGWQTVLTEDTEGGAFALHDTWLLVDRPTGAALYDLKAGAQTFSAPAVAVFAPSLDAAPPLPPLGTPVDALPPEPAPDPSASPRPSPRPAPVRAKAKGKAKAGKHKAKAP